MYFSSPLYLEEQLQKRHHDLRQNNRNWKEEKLEKILYKYIAILKIAYIKLIKGIQHVLFILFNISCKILFISGNKAWVSCLMNSLLLIPNVWLVSFLFDRSFSVKYNKVDLYTVPVKRTSCGSRFHHMDHTCRRV